MLENRPLLKSWLTWCSVVGILAAAGSILEFQIGALASRAPQSISTLVWAPIVLLGYPGYVAAVLAAGHMDAGFGDLRDALFAFFASGLVWGSVLFAIGLLVRRLRHLGSGRPTPPAT